MDRKERPIELLFPACVNRCVFYRMTRIGESPMCSCAPCEHRFWCKYGYPSCMIMDSKVSAKKQHVKFEAVPEESEAGQILESPARLDIQLSKSIRGHDRYQW